MPPRVTRLDLHRLDAIEETPSGALRVPARLARVGVLQYDDGQGNAWGELVPPETLFDAASLASMRGVALTDLHPGEKITPETRKSLAVGHVGDDVKRDGDYLAAPVYVTDAPEIALVRSGARRDVSCGYTCGLDETPGTFDGVPYRAVQRGRVYNHLGLGPEGWGRAGTDVSLRLDGAAHPAVARLDAAHARIDTTHTTGGGSTAAPATTGNDTTMKTIKIGGKTYRLDAEAEMVEAQKKVDEVEGEAAKAPDLSASLDAAQKALMDAMATIARMKAELVLAQSAKPEVAEADVPEAVVDSIVSKRLASLDAARTAARLVAPAVKLDGLTKPRAIHAAALAAVMPEVKTDGLTDDTVAGMFSVLDAAAKTRGAKRADANGKIADVLAPTQEQADEAVRQDAANAPFDPIAQQRASLQTAGRAPLKAS